MDEERKRKQAAAHAQRLRDKRKTSGNNDIRVTLSPDEMTKLDDICQFFAYPSEPYAQVEALQSLIHRAHAEIPKIESDLGCCAKLREGGLFNRDAMCWHTTNRVRIMPPAKGVAQ